MIIYTDDQGSVDLNCYGAKDLHTPNMDKFAGQVYTVLCCFPCMFSFKCSAALMTGKTPQTAGLPANAPSRKGKPGMPTDQVTIAEVMKDAD